MAGDLGANTMAELRQVVKVGCRVQTDGGDPGRGTGCVRAKVPRGR